MTLQAARLRLDQAERIPTSAMSEAQLLDGYRHPAVVMRRVQCASGDWLTAAQGDERGVLAAVVTHNESTAHQQWRRRREAA